jgi:glycolate oxidase FAD binding subunit
MHTINQDAALRALQDQLQAAIADRTPLAITGSGSKTWLSPVSIAGLRRLDVQSLAGISAYEPSELVITARAGTPLAELEAALAERGQCLPFEPPRFALADGLPGGSVGGMVASGLAGPARASVGSVRDYVLGATILNGRAELLSFGGQVMKNVAGYDVSRLLAGSMGVLGLICEVSLKVLPQPVASATLRFELSQAEALARLKAWCRQPLPLNASAWHRGVLQVRLSGAQAAVVAAQHVMGGERVDDELARRNWDALRDQQSALFVDAAAGLPLGQRLWRLSVPPHTPVLALPGALGRAADAADTTSGLIEWHGGQRWLLSDAPPSQLHALAAEVGGHARIWRGALPGDAVQPALSAALQSVHQRIKDAFDPHHLFNPGQLAAGL